MKVAVLGAGLLGVTSAWFLRQNGHDVDVFILNKTNINNNLYNLVIINRFILSFFYYLNLFCKIDLSFLFMIYMKLILKKNYDVFHFHFLNFKLLYLLKLLKKTKQKILVTFHGIDIQIDKEINYGYRLNKNYEKSLFDSINDIDVFFYLSNTIKKDLLEILRQVKK